MSETADKSKKRKSKDGKEKKSKKSKLDKTADALPHENGDAVDESKRKSKKRKRVESEVEQSPNDQAAVPLEESLSPKKSKKSKKSKRDGRVDADDTNHLAQPSNGVQDGGHKERDEAAPAKKSKKSKKEKKEKKDRSKFNEDVTEEAGPEGNTAETNGTTPQNSQIQPEGHIYKKKGKPSKHPNKDKARSERDDGKAEADVKKKNKQKKSKKPKTDAPEQANGVDTTTNAGAEDEGQTQEDGQAGTKSRFIAFIGNLPFTATKGDIAKHFKKVEPSNIRPISHKDTGKSKGFAFLEFDRFDKMKSCLKLYHHSKFDDGKSPARSINVELTVGGGGTAENRKAKLTAKNGKLDDERKRRKEAELNGGKPVAVPEEVPKTQDAHLGMHPSRMARMGI